MNEQVDDLVVWVDFGPIDGFGGIGAWAGVCRTRSNGLPIVSSNLFDEANGEFPFALALHELGHTLGFGEIWDDMGLIVDPVLAQNGAPGVLETVEDATVSSFSADTNYGLPGSDPLTTNLVVGNNLGDWTTGPDDEELQAFLKFDLTGVQFENPIIGATAVFHCTDGTTPGPLSETVGIGPVLGRWDESSLTWNSRPTTGTNEDSFNFTAPCSRVLLDVSGTLDGWLTGAVPNHGLYVALGDVANTDANLGFETRHASTDTVRPKLFISAETHFTGSNALAQFDAAGGAAYPGLKVPLENRFLSRGTAVDGHWHSFFLGTEVMSSTLFMSAKLSAITLGALDDMGYEVDYSRADPFQVSNIP